MSDEFKPHLIERYALDSGSLKSASYERQTLVIEFINGSLFAYADFPLSKFDEFAAAESKGRFYAQEIKGKYTSTKLTGMCPSCGSAPEIIGEICSDCGTGIVREVDTVHKEQYEGEDRVKRDLVKMRKTLGVDDDDVSTTK